MRSNHLNYPADKIATREQEITRLKTELIKVRSIAGEASSNVQILHLNVKQLEAENERLRKALLRAKEIVDSLECECDDAVGFTCSIHADRRLIDTALGSSDESNDTEAGGE